MASAAFRMRTFRFLFAPLVALLGLSACNKPALDPPQAPATPADPAAMYTVLRTATMQPQGGVPSGGTLAVEQDAAGAEFVRFDASFVTDFHTGSLGVYLARSADNVRNQRAAAAANVLRVGTIVRAGAQRLAVPGSATGYTHVIIHCEAAQYNFGAAPLR